MDEFNLELNSNNLDNDLRDVVAEICFDLNKLSASVPLVDVEPLVTGVHALVSGLDSVLAESEAKSGQLQGLQRDLAELTNKLDLERTQRRLDLDRSLSTLDTSEEENNLLKKRIQRLEEKLLDTEHRCKDLLADNYRLKDSIKVEKAFNTDLKKQKLDVEVNYKKLTLRHEELAVQSAKMNEDNGNREWSKQRWVDDTALDSHFQAISETNKNILFLGPSATQLIKYSSETALEITTLESYHNCKYVFLCVNNSLDLTKEDGGSHWSLLFYEKEKDLLFHFDSLKGMNLKHAQQIAKNLCIPVSNVLEMPCYQQRNNFECGINVLVNLKYIMNYFNMKSGTNKPFRTWYEATAGDVFHTSTKPTQSVCTRNSVLPAASKIKLKKVNDTSWQVVRGKLNVKQSEQNPSVPCSNKFKILSCEECVGVGDNESNVEKEVEKLQSSKIRNKTNNGNLKKVHSKKRKYVEGKGKNAMNVEPRCGSGAGGSGEGRRRVILLSDSHGRSLAPRLLETNPDSVQVMAFVKPNARFSDVIGDIDQSSVGLNKSDSLVIFAGTNDVSGSFNENSLLESIKYFVQKTRHTRVIFIGIPYRKDQPSLNSIISKTNDRICEFLNDVEHVNFVSLSSLYNRRFYTNFGLHFNGRGKHEIVKLIHTHLSSVTSKPPQPTLNPIPVILTDRRTVVSGRSAVVAGSHIVSQVFTNSNYFLGKGVRLGRGP